MVCKEKNLIDFWHEHQNISMEVFPVQNLVTDTLRQYYSCVNANRDSTRFFVSSCCCSFGFPIGPSQPWEAPLLLAAESWKAREAPMSAEGLLPFSLLHPCLLCISFLPSWAVPNGSVLQIRLVGMLPIRAIHGAETGRSAARNTGVPAGHDMGVGGRVGVRFKVEGVEDRELHWGGGNCTVVGEIELLLRRTLGGDLILSSFGGKHLFGVC